MQGLRPSSLKSLQSQTPSNPKNRLPLNRLQACSQPTKQWRLAVERASYEAQRAERRYRAVDPDNRLVARGLEREWEACLKALEAAKADLARREAARPHMISQQERDRLLALGPDLVSVWNASTTTPRDQKELRTLLDEVVIKVDRDAFAAHLTLRWKGGALTEIDLALPRSRPATIRTDEDTVALLRRLAVHYRDAVIAGILNRQGRTTAYGHRFDRNRVGNLRRHWKIPSFQEKPRADGDLLTIKQAANALGVAPSTIHVYSTTVSSSCQFTYSFEPRRRAGPAQGPGRGRMFAIALGCPPSLQTFREQRCGPVAFVQVVHWYYADIRLLVDDDAGLMAFAFPQSARRLFVFGRRRDLPLPVRRISPHAQALRPRGAVERLAMCAAQLVAFRLG
ncbi:hypothetical protein [Bradyrhizobium sp. USDA 4506]